MTTASIDYQSLAEKISLWGKEFGFSCPDNLLFDKKGNFFFATDISGSTLGTKRFKSFGNNGIFVVPYSGKYAGDVLQIASSPIEAEFTGLQFDPEEKNLFVSVQHPGERSKSIENPTSRWPFDDDGIPKSSVISIKGIKELLS